MLNQNAITLLRPILTELPIKHLGAVLRAGALMGDTFENAPMETAVLHQDGHFWRTLFEARFLLSAVANNSETLRFTFANVINPKVTSVAYPLPQYFGLMI